MKAKMIKNIQTSITVIKVWHVQVIIKLLKKYKKYSRIGSENWEKQLQQVTQ